MSVKRSAAAFVAGIAAVGALALPAVTSAKPQAKASVTVDVLDDYFTPDEVSIKKNSKINWKWDPDNTNTHNVVLQKGPKGVKLGCKTKGKDAFSPLISKCNKSESGSVGIKFKKKFDVAGSYNFLCTIHPTVMKFDVKVKK
jgi:plastocyanin